MDLGLDGWRVLVTGGTSGVGQAIAAELAAEGAAVAAAGRSASADSGSGPGTGIPVIGADLTTPEGAEALIAEAVDLLGGLDGLVLGAGGAVEGALEEVDDATLQYALELNLLASARAIRAAVPALRHSPGRILLLTARSASEPRAGHGPSNMAKAGLAALGKTASREFASDGILVNCLAPGRLRSRQVDRAFDPEARERFASAHIPLGRFGDPEEAAPVAALLISPRNTYITGETVHVDGGMGQSL